jgi:hypothetical protein
MSGLFYLQDSRCYVGNDVLWWAKDGKGYTTDLSKAEVYSFEDAQRLHNSRETDVPWPKDYIDGKTRPAVDMQYIRRDEALAGTGIVLKQPEKPKRKTYRCECGRFVKESEYYASVYHGNGCFSCRHSSNAKAQGDRA